MAPRLTREDFGKLPAWWYPTLSAKSAGAVKLKEGWGRLWFEAIAEILYQAGAAGLPALYELLARDTKTYHGIVVVRLLRFAANGVRKKEILNKVKARLPELNFPAGPESVDEAMIWAAHGDPRLSKILRSMSKIKLKGIGAETVGSVMKEWADSRAMHLRD